MPLFGDTLPSIMTFAILLPKKNEFFISRRRHAEKCRGIFLGSRTLSLSRSSGETLVVRSTKSPLFPSHHPYHPCHPLHSYDSFPSFPITPSIPSMPSPSFIRFIPLFSPLFSHFIFPLHPSMNKKLIARRERRRRNFRKRHVTCTPCSLREDREHPREHPTHIGRRRPARNA